MSGTSVAAPTFLKVKAVTKAVAGGRLPQISSPLYELLLIGVTLTIVETVSFCSCLNEDNMVK